MLHAPALHLAAPLLPAPGGGAHHAGDPTTELIAVGLLLLFYWGLFRVTAKKAAPPS